MKEYVDYSDFFVKRLISLRMQKGVSARDMSLSLGQSDGYINKIENRKALPSMTGFFYICDYFDITPAEFFSEGELSPSKTREIAETASRLKPETAGHLMAIMSELAKK